MAEQRIDVTPTPAVQRAHDQCFGKQKDLENPSGIEKLTPDEVEFIAERDSFYLASVNETGWPYVQHHGGPPGFIRVLGPNFVGFADFKRQPVTTGKIVGADRVVLFLMDYPNRTRLKLMKIKSRAALGFTPLETQKFKRSLVTSKISLTGFNQPLTSRI